MNQFSAVKSGPFCSRAIEASITLGGLRAVLAALLLWGEVGNTSRSHLVLLASVGEPFQLCLVLGFLLCSGLVALGREAGRSKSGLRVTKTAGGRSTPSS
jgi:hypothetical protein